MSRKRYRPEEIIGKLRETEVLLSKGQPRRRPGCEIVRPALRDARIRNCAGTSAALEGPANEKG